MKTIPRIHTSIHTHTHTLTHSLTCIHTLHHHEEKRAPLLPLPLSLLSLDADEVLKIQQERQMSYSKSSKRGR